MPEDPAVPPLSEQSTLDQAASSSPGSFGRYRLLQRLGEGGMGEVWLGEQTEPVRRQVALKVVKAGMDSTQVVARFEAERQALAVMDHPVIATVFDGGTTPQGRPYFAMEYVKGEPITSYCDRHRLSTSQRLELFMQVCEGVQHAHQKGIIHRDLKPSNVLVTIQDDRPVPKIIDFGVAKATAQHLTERSLFTELGVLIGTPEYMSPEQAEMGGLDIDTRTDIYALGVLLYELLTGLLPFDHKELRQAGLAEIQRIIREKEPRRPSTRITQLGPASTEAATNRHTEPRRLASELRGDLDWITMRALEKDRTRRYQTANALAADVRRHLGNEPVSAGPPSAAYRAGKFVRRHRFGVGSAAILVLLLAAFSVVMAVQVRRTARERDKAQRLATFMVDLFKVSDPSEARGNAITAREVLDKGAEKISRELKDEPETRGMLMATMGRVYRSLGLYGPATLLLEDALRIRRETLGGAHPEVAASLDDLAWLLRQRGDYPRAEALAREALALERRAFGNRSVEAARSLYLVGTICRDRGDLASAEPLARESLLITREALGSEHPETLSAMNLLAAVLYSKGDLSGAGPLFSEILALRRRLQGSDHPTTISAISNLASVRLREGNYEAAEPLLRESVESSRRVYGEHPTTAVAVYNLALLLNEEGKLSEAAALGHESLAMNRKLVGREHPHTADTLELLGEIQLGQGEYRSAEALIRDALAVRKKALGSRHRDVADSLSALAALLLLTERADQAERVAREAVEIDRESLSVDDPARAAAEKMLGECLIKLRRFEEAEPLLLGSYRVLQAAEPKRRGTQRALRAVVALYEAWGKPERAREWRAKLEGASAAADQSEK